MKVDIMPATSDDLPVVANLLELYLHDFSAVEPSDVGPDGRFGYPHLEQYWEDPARKAFVVRVDGKLAGCALIKRGSALAGDLEAMDVAEFFVLRAYRRKGVGRAAARAIWDRFPGRWLVRVLKHNPDAVRFWKRAIAHYTDGRFTEELLDQEISDGPPRRWVIFRFTSNVLPPVSVAGTP